MLFKSTKSAKIRHRQYARDLLTQNICAIICILSQSTTKRYIFHFQLINQSIKINQSISLNRFHALTMAMLLTTLFFFFCLSIGIQVMPPPPPYPHGDTIKTKLNKVNLLFFCLHILANSQGKNKLVKSTPTFPSSPALQSMVHSVPGNFTFCIFCT